MRRPFCFKTEFKKESTQGLKKYPEVPISFLIKNNDGILQRKMLFGKIEIKKMNSTGPFKKNTYFE